MYNVDQDPVHEEPQQNVYQEKWDGIPTEEVMHGPGWQQSKTNTFSKGFEHHGYWQHGCTKFRPPEIDKYKHVIYIVNDSLFKIRNYKSMIFLNFISFYHGYWKFKYIQYKIHFCLVIWYFMWRFIQSIIGNINQFLIYNVYLIKRWKDNVNYLFIHSFIE